MHNTIFIAKLLCGKKARHYVIKHNMIAWIVVVILTECKIIFSVLLNDRHAAADAGFVKRGCIRNLFLINVADSLHCYICDIVDEERCVNVARQQCHNYY